MQLVYPRGGNAATMRMVCDQCGRTVTSITFAFDIPEGTQLTPCGHHASITFTDIKET